MRQRRLSDAVVVHVLFVVATQPPRQAAAEELGHLGVSQASPELSVSTGCKSQGPCDLLSCFMYIMYIYEALARKVCAYSLGSKESRAQLLKVPGARAPGAVVKGALRVCARRSC